MSVSVLVEHYPYAALFLLLLLGFLGFPFPEDMTLLLCGFLLAGGVIEPLPALLLVYCVLFGLDAVFFFAGRKYGAAIVNRKTFRRLISPRRLEQLEKKVEKWGIFLLVIGRHVIVLRTQLLIAAGVFRMRVVKFLAADAISVPLTMAIMIGLGYAGGSSLQVLEQGITRIEHLALLFVIALVMFYVLYRFIRYRRG